MDQPKQPIRALKEQWLAGVRVWAQYTKEYPRHIASLWVYVGKDPDTNQYRFVQWRDKKQSVVMYRGYYALNTIDFRPFLINLSKAQDV